MDGYSGCGKNRATDVVNQFPDLMGYSETAPACVGSAGTYSCVNSWVRVDDINLAVQTYNDLVAVKNTLAADNPTLSGIGTESTSRLLVPMEEQVPGDQYGQDEIWHFAKSRSLLDLLRFIRL